LWDTELILFIAVTSISRSCSRVFKKTFFGGYQSTQKKVFFCKLSLDFQRPSTPEDVVPESERNILARVASVVKIFIYETKPEVE
jgi:hypothetical protein